jgi:hypothetical protein
MNEPKKPPSLPVPLDSRRLAGARGGSGVLVAQPPTEGGFSAMLQHAGLWDLVQLRCESRVRCVVCVTCGQQVGYLYFSEGQIVHSVTGGVQGEHAVLEILSWTAGTWESCDRPWPTVPTITTSWQGLFLRAAQKQDEAKRQGVAPEAPLRDSQPQPVAVRLAPPPPSTLPSGVASDALSLSALASNAPALSALASNAGARREESGVSYRLEDFEHAVRMDARGTIVNGQGAAEDHAELAAYCCRLGDLLGELLGMGKLRAIDGALKGGERCFVVREDSGDTVVLRARAGADVSAIRAQLKL